MLRKFIVLFILLVSVSYATGKTIPVGINTISAAIRDADNGEFIELLDGVYIQTEQIDIRNKSLSIFGKGPEVTIIKCNRTNGINIVTNSNTKHVTLKDFTLSTTYSGGYSAIQFRANETISNSSKQFLIENISIRPDDYARNYWGYGIKIQEGWNTIIRNCFIRGKNNSRNMITAIELNGCSTDIKIESSHIFFANRGISIGGTSEGVHITNCTMVYLSVGVWWNAPGAESLLNISGCHISVFGMGIYTYNIHWSQIANNMIMKRHDSGDNFVAIFLNKGNLNTIMGNTILGKGISGSENGIVISSCDYTSAIGNVFKDQETDIWIRNGSYKCVVKGNTGNGKYYHLFDQGVNTITIKE